jgi:hypothetical protein
LGGRGQVPLPGEPAQFDFEGVPIAPAALADAIDQIEGPPAVSPAQLPIPGVEPEQLDFWAARRGRYELANALRANARPRVAKCGRVRIVPTLEIRLQHGRAHVVGLLACGSVWECPPCSARIRAERATEVQTAVAWHGVERTSMVTLTVRHGLGSDLKALRAGVAEAWRFMQQGSPWKRFRERVLLKGTIRALEVTHGPNGWHPHLHLLAMVDDPSQLLQEREWLAIRWRACVARALGDRHLPSLEHGCTVTPCHDGAYLAKLGLELAGGAKIGRPGHRTPWQIAHDAADHETDSALWRTYCNGMFGARMLTWSKGLRDAAGLGAELDDEALAAAADVAAARVCFVPGAIWDALRVTPGVLLALLEAAETGGAHGVARVISRVLRSRSWSNSRGPPE